MILACPSCHARYLVPAAHFATGPRTVRCARCAHMWMAELENERSTAVLEELSALSPPNDEVKAPQPAFPQQLPTIQEENRLFRGRDWIIAVLATGLALALLFSILDRRDIAQRWPVTEKYYDAVHLHIFHSGEGLSLRDVRSEMRFDGGITKLNVDGEVHNDSLVEQPIPNILAAAIGPDGKTMQSWQIDAPAPTVLPGETVPFTSSVNAPEGTVAQMHLHFIEQNNGQ